MKKTVVFVVVMMMVATAVTGQNTKKRLNAIDSTLTQRAADIMDLQARLNEEDSLYRSDIGGVREDIEALQQTVDRQNKTISQMQNRINALEEQLQAVIKGDLDEYVENPVTTEDTLVWLVQQYYGAKRWQEQLHYVLNPERMEPLMRRYYSNGYTQERIKKSLITVQDEEVAMGKVTRVEADIYTVYVKRTELGYKIDWQGTTGTDDYSFSAFKAEKSTVTRQFRVTARLGNEYASDYGLTNTKFYCVKIGETAYVAKNSEAGKQLYDIIKDGFNHDVIVQVRYEKKNIKSGYSRMFPIIVGFVKEGWSME